MAHTVTLPLKLELTSAVVVRPGDKLILGYSRPVISEHDAATLRHRIGERLPGVDLVIIADIAHMAVYRDGADDSTIAKALRDIWNRIEELDKPISPAWLRKVIVESGAWRGHEDD